MAIKNKATSIPTPKPIPIPKEEPVQTSIPRPSEIKKY